MSDWQNLHTLKQEFAEAGEPALLFSIVDIQGSSYRKLGAHMLIGKSGRQAGTISAGCLESDLLSQIDDFFAGELPRVVSYDNRGDDVFALNAGCAGAICILIEDAFADSQNPLAVFADTVLAERTTGTLATIIDGPANLVGTRLSPEQTGQLIRDHNLLKTAVVDTTLDEETSIKIAVEFIQPPLRLIIFGAQQDGRLLAQLAANTGMTVLLVDWRPRLLEEKFSAVETLRRRGEQLQEIATDSRTAIVIMSHNFEEDKAALSCILKITHALPYRGIMGPRKRTMQMLTDLDCLGRAEDLNFPVGLDIGADSPEEIAVSIVAEIISVLARTSSRSLCEKGAPIHASVS